MKAKPPANHVAFRTAPKGDVTLGRAACDELAGIIQTFREAQPERKLMPRITEVSKGNIVTFYLSFDPDGGAE